jgi:hypothetical protein
MKSQKRQRIVEVFSLLILLLAAGDAWYVQADTHQSKEEREEFSFDKAAAEAQLAHFPPTFLDSLKRAKAIAFSPGLRSMPADSLRREKLVYKCSWGPFDAGYGIVDYAVDSATKMVHVTADGVSNDFISAFFRVRDHLSCIVDRTGWYPLFLEEHVREGRYKADRWILYDHRNECVFIQKKPDSSITVPKFCQSIVSILYSLRRSALQPGTTFAIDCFVQTKNYHVVFKCLKRETIKTDLGTFSCVLVEPVLEGEGRVLTKKDKLRIWLNEDRYHTPVYIKTKLAFGFLSIQLMQFEQE